MLIERIRPAECDDPDVVQAIDDFLETAAEIRTRTAALVHLKRGSPAFSAERAHIHELMTQIEARASRLDLTTDALMVLLNQALNRKARRGRAEPARPTMRTLLTELTNAQAAEAQADLEVRAARAKQAACQARVSAAAAAYKAWGSKPFVDAA